MALYLEELKQVFKEQEEEAGNIAAELQKLKAEALKARQELERERLELAKEKAQAQREQAAERLRLAREKERRAAEAHELKRKQAEKRAAADSVACVVSLLVTFGGILASVVLFITILLKG